MISIWYGVEGLLFTLLTYSTLSSAQTGNTTLPTTALPSTSAPTAAPTTKRLMITETQLTGPNNTNYTLYREKKTWLEAKQKCEKENARLAVLDTNATQEYITEYINSTNITSERIWIGATDKMTEGIWFWVTGPLISEPKNWDRWDLGLVVGDEPNGEESENCMNINQVNPGKWNDASCETKMSFLCQKDACTSRNKVSCPSEDGKVRTTNWTECVDGNQTRVKYCVPPQNGGRECNVTGKAIEHRECGKLATRVILVSSLSAWGVLICVFFVAMVKLKRKEIHNKSIMNDYRLGTGKFGKKKKESGGSPTEKIANDTKEEDEGQDPAAIPLVKVSPAE